MYPCETGTPSGSSKKMPAVAMYRKTRTYFRRGPHSWGRRSKVQQILHICKHSGIFLQKTNANQNSCSITLRWINACRYVLFCLFPGDGPVMVAWKCRISLHFTCTRGVYRMKCIGCHSSRAGTAGAFSPRSPRSIQARLWARVRMVCIPSVSCAT